MTTTKQPSFHIAIVGGGVAGLSSAIALRLNGFMVSVFEQAESIGEVGAGLQLSANAWRALDGLIDTAALKGLSQKPRALVMRSYKTPHTFLRLELNAWAEQYYEGEYWQVHRADLIAALSARAQELGAAVCCAHRFTRFTKNEQGQSVLHFEARQPITADFIFAADGVHSSLQPYLGSPAPARFSGQLAWRALIDCDRLPAKLLANIENAATVYLGPKGHVVLYYLRSQNQLNIVAVDDVRHSHEAGSQYDESWLQGANIADMRARFAHWQPLLVDLFEHIDEAYVWPLYERPKLETWSNDELCLLGDAAHPMLPFLAQGAAMALEDAAFLKSYFTLEQFAQRRECLALFEAQRKPRVTRVQKIAWQNAELFHIESPVLRFFVYAAMRVVGYVAKRFFYARLRWLYGHKPS